MNEPPPIYGATANAWSDALDEEKKRHDHNGAFFLFGLGAVFALASCLYPALARHSATVSDWNCPPRGVLESQIEAVERTWVTQSRRHGRIYRVQIDCRSFLPKTEIAAAETIIRHNRLSLILWAFGLIAGAAMVRFKLFLPGSWNALSK